MSRAHLHRSVTDSEGNVVPNTKVTIYEAGTSQLLIQSIYQTSVGSGQQPNPWTTSDGYISIYLDKPQTVRIGLAVQGSPETYIEDVPVLPGPENLVQALVGFQIANAPAPGQYLQSGQAGVAAWVDAADVINSKPSPLLQVKTYDWSGAVLDDATVLDASGQSVAPSFVDVSADAKPSGWSFTKAMKLPVTGPITVVTPPQTYQEPGSAIFLYKVVSTSQGVGAASLHFSMDSDALSVDTPTVADMCNVWQVGYLDKVPTGSHQVRITHRPGTDTSSYVLLGPVWMQYGNNIPAHDHNGSATDSTKIGTNASADFAGGTAVGSGAKALDQNATAFGYLAQANLTGVAVGASAVAAVDSVAVGHNATGNLSLDSSVTPATPKGGWVAVGKSANAGELNAVAVGARSAALGPRSIAVGPDTKTGSPAEAIAIGSGAQALALRAVALGQGAIVAAGHDYSLAIGPGAVTTAAHQAVIGDAGTTVVVPGSLRQTGGDAVFGGPGSKLGFFGSAGITRPTVQGSRGGNATLAALLSLLANMGLIVDGSTS